MVKIRVSCEKPEELEQVLAVLKDSGNEPKKVKVPAKGEGKRLLAYMEIELPTC